MHILIHMHMDPDRLLIFHMLQTHIVHMHTSMLFVSRGRAIPSIGEWIDVQQPMTRVQVDLLQWIR